MLSKTSESNGWWKLQIKRRSNRQKENKAREQLSIYIREIENLIKKQPEQDKTFTNNERKEHLVKSFLAEDQFVVTVQSM